MQPSVSTVSTVTFATSTPLNLICFAHAGGSAALYRRWKPLLPDGVTLIAAELPGHGTRRAQAAHTGWRPLIAELADEIGQRLDRTAPFAVFGHSMGALVGFELCHALRQRDGRMPLWFGASASVAPSRRNVESDWLDCPRETMVAKLAELGGTPAELLADADFVDFMLPVLRADFHLCGVYTEHRRASSPRLPLECRIDAFTGRDDRATAQSADVDAWAACTQGDFGRHEFSGGHFFLEAHAAAVLDTLTAVAVEQ
ncbi:surfactin synthase thioesterase subunit [Paraburkholderia sp. BL21I4N1]|nr:surfactin synthase thioesterase subunit [Paraburkholderia sp. BL21I4N1]